MAARKPYAVIYRGEGREGDKAKRAFATLAEAAAYCWGRYEGVEYFDGPDGFHNDYATFELVGFVLADIYDIDYGNWHAAVKPELTPRRPAGAPLTDREVETLSE